MQIGNETVGVRIAVRDMATPPESQIYHWGIKESAPLESGGSETSPNATGVSSDALLNNPTVLQASESVKTAPDTRTPPRREVARQFGMGDSERNKPFRIEDNAYISLIFKLDNLRRNIYNQMGTVFSVFKLSLRILQYNNYQTGDGLISAGHL